MGHGPLPWTIAISTQPSAIDGYLRSGFAVRLGRRADLQVESVRRCRVIALVAGRVDVAAAAGVDTGVEPAFLELRFHLIGIEWCDPARDVPHRGTASRPWRRAAAAAAAAADDDVADVADLALVLAAFVGPRLPAEQRRVERHRLLVFRHLERDV